MATENIKARGAHACAAALSPERRSEIASAASIARWHGPPKVKKRKGRQGGPREIPISGKTAGNFDNFRMTVDGIWQRAQTQGHHEIADDLVTLMDQLGAIANKMRRIPR